MVLGLAHGHDHLALGSILRSWDTDEHVGGVQLGTEVPLHLELQIARQSFNTSRKR